MIKFAIRNCIVTTVTILTLLLTGTYSNAQQVNMKFLSQVVKGCQRDTLSPKYYKKMRLSTKITEHLSKNEAMEKCVRTRYHHSLFMSKFSWLKSSGNMLPGYPGYVAVASLANFSYPSIYKSQFLDCLVSKNASSKECGKINFSQIVTGSPMTHDTGTDRYFFYVCPSCLVTYNDTDYRNSIIQAFINWLTKLEKHQIKQVVEVLSEDNKSSLIRKEIEDTADAAVYKYIEVRQRVEQQERERRHQELIGK